MEQQRLIDVEKKVAGQEVLLSRVDAALDKITEVSLNVSKLLAVHEQRLEAQEEASRKLDGRADELHSRVTSAEQRLRTEMTEHQKEILTEIKSLRTDMNDLSGDLREQNEVAKSDITKDFDDKIDKINNKISTIERVQWLAIGGAAVIGFLLSQVVGVLQLFQ
jgi:chromosome segregation ATPase